MTRLAHGSMLGFPLLTLFALLLGTASPSQAATVSCVADYGGVIDGNNFTAGTLPSSIQIDGDCTFQNFPQGAKFPNGLTSTINFYFDGFLVIFNNVYYTGNMACANTTDKIWFANSSLYGSNNTCQDLFIPVETIDKQNPAGQTTAAIGEPFTYTLTLPSMQITGDPSVNDLHTVTLWDDLSRTATGADLTFVSINAYYKGSGTPVTLVPETDPAAPGGVWTPKNLSYEPIPLINAGDQIIVEITVVLDDTPANTPGTPFFNTAQWSFGRLIDGVFYEPLPGESGVTPPMTIVAPGFVFTKTSSQTNLNVGAKASFTLDTQNTGSSDAWNTTITDNLPAGMCIFDPRPTVTAQIFAADGVTPVSGLLVNGTDFSVSWNGGAASACQLSLTMLTPAATIGPTQHLIIIYQGALDAGTPSGLTFTNVAGATQWFSAASTNPGRHEYDTTLTNGTPGVLDFQDAYTITSATIGYYLLKSVQDLTTGANPATVAFPGDTLRYTLQLQNFNIPPLTNITISDDLGSLNASAFFVPGSLSLVAGSSTFPLTATITANPTGGTNGEGLITITNFDLPSNIQYQIQFDIVLASPLSNGTTVTNQGSISGTNLNGNVAGVSDDPFINGPALLGTPSDPTSVTIQSPGALTKANTQATATIGQQFSYLVTVPATPIGVPLYDVRILDDLGLSAADMSFVSAQVVSGGSWSLTNTGTATNLVIQDTNTGIDIPAGGQAVIEITVELLNTNPNQDGLAFANSASYTYNRMNGNNATQTTGGGGGTGNMNVVEPDLTASKTTSYVSPAGKPATDPAAAGDVLQYVVTIPNNGSSTAFDTSVVDTLPVNVSLVPGSATATINAVPVAGFVVDPTPLPGGALAWGAQNGDSTLDIPVGQSLVLTYRVTVGSVNGLPINNSVYVDWTSLQAPQGVERTGLGCPTITAPNDYCFGPVSATLSTVDTTTIAKSVVSDSWSSGLSTGTDSILRVGDTVVYRLTLPLREGQLQNVVVTDTLPAGLAFDSVVSINGDTSAPFSQIAPFTYADFTAPTVSGNTVTWSFGDITNAVDNNPANDAFVIEYQARVITDTLPQQLVTNLANTVNLAYTGSAVLNGGATITVWQPIMSTPTKTDRAGRTSPAQVNVTTDVMQFRLESCNNGTAPAYSVMFTDLLASQLEETTITPPAVTVGGTPLTAGVDYTYTPPAVRGGTMTFLLNTPVDPGQCVTIDYDIGFHTDFGPNQTWDNSLTLNEYWSLPLQSGQRYGPVGPATFTMTNSTTVSQPSKSLTSPGSGEATIGEDVIYRVTVPTTVANAALFDVTVTDTLNGALEYLSATDVSGNSFALTDNSVAPDQVNLTIAQIPAGQQAIIEVHARVANNSAANAGLSFQNSASYTYADTAGGPQLSGGTATTSTPLRIIEPDLTLTKSVTNVTNPGVAPTIGDTLGYTLVFTAGGGTPTDSYSNAFDLSITEALPLGLAYQGNVTVSGAGNTIAAPVITGDGITTPQSLQWDLASSNADIDIPEGTAVTVYYEVQVQGNILSGQTLTASSFAQWTGLDGVNPYERTGTGTPPVNDYFLGPVTVGITTQLPVLTFTKTVYDVTTGQSGATARPGDRLRYTLTIQNVSLLSASNFSLTDELDALNATAMFVPGSLTLVNVPAGADTTLTSPTGGTKGTGLVSISNLNIDPLGGLNDTLVIEFEVDLVPVITSGSVVLNQGQIGSSTLLAQLSDDPSLPGTTDPTRTLIASAPDYQVLKTVQDITSGTATVTAGDTLRYTITVKNDGTEDATGVTLRDLIPANTTYQANTTTLNGTAVADPSAGVSALENGMLINPPGMTAGSMPADASANPNNVATITFEVQISPNVIDGTLISNQGFVNGSGIASGPFPEQPSDDPATPVVNDPTTVVVGNLPLVYALKTVQLAAGGDVNGNGLVDPGDTLLYTITLTNSAATPATGVVLTDAIPANTTYVSNSTTLNGATVTDPSVGVSQLANGMGVVSSGLPAPSPPSSGGTLAAGGTGTVTFEVTVNAGVSPGTVISNQGTVATAQLTPLLTDSDGNPSNGYQPTLITVGDAQQLSITKSYAVVGGGAPLPGSEVEYTVQVTNIGTVPATTVVITDDLNPLAAQVTYVANSATMNGSTNGVSDASSIITANYGTLAPGGSVVVRFRVTLNSTLIAGTNVTNTAQVDWNAATQTAQASVTLTIGAQASSLSGQIWQDSNFNNIFDGAEQGLFGWAVDVYRDGQLVGTVTTASDGTYQINGLPPNAGTSSLYELRFHAQGAGPNTAMLGWADSPVIYGFTNGMQRISDIVLPSGSSLLNLNLPLTPNGVVYNSVTRQPIAGVTLTMVQASTMMPLATGCFNDPVQQGQVTLSSGYYKFDLRFGDPSCPSPGDYLIEFTPPVSGYTAGLSRVIPPTSSATTAAIDVPTCTWNASSADAIPGTPNYCEAEVSDQAPAGSNTTYYLHLTLDNPQPGSSQIFNNHIAVDPTLNTAIAITKTSPLVNVTRGQLVPYTITLRNTLGATLQNLIVIDTFPPGFKYVAGSGQVDGQKIEPNMNSKQLSWSIAQLTSNSDHKITLMMIVGSGVSEGEYVNRAQVINQITQGAASEIASATVRVVPDPDFDCTDVIGKVFDDANANGYPDPDEKGLDGVRIVTPRGLVATTDPYGRFHITCAVVPDEDQGSNFILKLDERSLPSGYRLTTENPRVERATRGKMIRFNFGATIHRVVRLDIADGAFEPNTSEIRIQWRPKIEQVLEELKKGPSTLRLSYMGDAEPKSLVRERIEMLKKIITEQWKESEFGYRLTIETEIFWRRGGPASAGPETWIRESDAPLEGTEMNLPVDQPLTPWVYDPAAFEKDEGDRTEMREGVEKDIETVKLDNLVPAIHFGEGEAKIPSDYLKRLRDVLDRMRDRANVRLHFIGHTDSLPLRGDLINIYGDNVGLSRERAGTVAEYFQGALHLPPEAISYEGLGDSQPVATNATEKGRQQNRRVEVQVWYDKIGEKKTVKEVIVPREVNRIKVCRTENVCKLRYKEGQSYRARIRNVIPPLPYDKGMLSVPEKYLQQLRQAVTNLGGKQNLAIKFIGYTDNLPLEGRDKRIYGNALGLSKAVARRVSLAVQEDLGLSNAAIEIDGKGASHPLASNDTEQGRALNRRVEVEFWYDDPLQDLADEPQACPGAPGAETVTRVYDSPSGPIDPILFKNGDPVIPDGYTDKLRRMMDEISDKPHVRLQFIGYISDKRLDRRTAQVYGDDIGWSMARARRAMEAVREKMGLAEGQAEFDGRGYVQSDDVVNAGFIESDTSRVEVKVVYDDLIVRDDYEGVEVTPLTREVQLTNPFALNPMRISVDGKPIDDPDKSSPDVQRCTDVALENAKIEFKFDSLKLEPRLNVTAWPNTIQSQDQPETGFLENQVNFRLYTNYRSFIQRAEVRIFEEAQSVRDTPLAVVAMDADGMAHWQPGFGSVSAPMHKLKYLVRVYNKKGDFDETSPQPLWVVDHIDPSVAKADLGEKLLAGYGESRIATHNIPLSGGTVEAYGTAIPDGHGVWMAGYKVPVDPAGRFVAEEILPEGLHTVEVGVLDPSGNGKLYLRDLALKKSDWFTMGIADMTLSRNKTTGAAEQLQPDNQRYKEDWNLRGRLAFFTNGKFENGWSLKASADTREEPLDQIFSNFMDKSPDALLRRIDPDYHFPTFGDDSTVEQEAPTDGKFYLKLSKDKTYGLWGNFKIEYTDNDLVHVDRGLYGANLHIQPLNTTRFGEARLQMDGFAADPGTVGGRDEFLGTGGSLYFLRQQDILEGSERVRIEVRDKDSGIVVGVKNLTPVLDYDIDYIQGRIVLVQPLPTTADDGLLVSTSPISGNPVYLVVRYEFTPGFENPDLLDTGGRIHYWINDYVKVGVTASQDKVDSVRSDIGGADLTLRKSSESWVRLETGRTKGPGSLTTTSNNGGFNFHVSDPFDDTQVKASAYRIDSSFGFKDLFKNGRGTVTFYVQDLGAGYSAPGLATPTDLTQYGGTANLPVTDHLDAHLKMDKQIQEEGLNTEADELDLDYKMTEHWTLSSGVRRDSRDDNSVLVPATQEEGDRTDAVARLQYDSRARWSTYGFTQGTIQRSGDREGNNRTGIGGSLRLTDRFNLISEVSGGNLGPGGLLSSEYLYTDRTTLYTKYTYENDRTDNGLRARKGNMTSGFRTRYSDSASVYLEEHYTHGDVPTGLMHATGVDLAPTDRLNLGANLQFGDLKDHQTNADLKRTAAGANIGYGFDKLKIATALEYRVDNTEQPDTSTIRRTTWLLKNSLKYQVSPDWRIIAKFNYAVSSSPAGDNYDGEYTEAEVGYAFRPVYNDRLNALLKYTYFYNVPTSGQVTGVDTPANYIQRSHIGSMDLMYDLTTRWTVGGKYAYRYGQLSQNRDHPDYFTSRAHLVVLRADWHFVFKWDALVELRELDLPDAKDRRSGVLVGIYYHVGEHIKVGGGYNFSDFSDDLTQLDYRTQGLFINLIGKM